MGRALVLASCILPHLKAKLLSVFILNVSYLATVPSDVVDIKEFF